MHRVCQRLQKAEKDRASGYDRRVSVAKRRAALVRVVAACVRAEYCFEATHTPWSALGVWSSQLAPLENDRRERKAMAHRP